jgi:UDP-glucose 4-epimerase
VKLSTWRDANVTAALNLAQAAKQAGATKFILISTAHVHGRVHDGVVSDDTAPNPMDDYAASKLEAEAQVAAIFGPGLCIIRPVAVIGPHCPGNLPLLIKLLRAGIPLPFGSIVNQRSFIDAADLASLVLAALNAPAPPGMILAAHPEPVSTPALIRALAAGLGRPARLLPCPAGFLATAAKAAGRAAMWQSLAGSFVAAPKAALSLGWSPHQSISESLMETSRYYNTTTPGA